MWKVLRRLLFMIGVALLAGVVFRTTVFLRAQNALQTMPGEPKTEEDLKAWYPEIPATVENAASYYLKAVAAFTLPEYRDKDLPFFNGNDLPLPGDALQDATLKASEDFLAKNIETLRLLHDAAALPNCRYPENGGKEGEPHVSRAWPVLALEAVVHSERQNRNGAVDALLAGFAAASSLRSEPLMMNSIQRWWCCKSLLLALERVLTRMTLTDEQLVLLSKAVANADTSEGITQGLVGLRCGTSAYFRDSTKLTMELYEPNLMPEWVQGWRLQIYFLSGLADIERRRFNALIHDWQEMRKLSPFAARKDAAEALQRRFNNASDWQTPITRAFLSETTIIVYTILESCHQARLTVAEVALAIERYRLKNGMLPDNLNELAPVFLQTLPVDPLNDQPLSYQQTAQGYSISSVGADVPHAQLGRSWVTREDIVFAARR